MFFRGKNYSVGDGFCYEGIISDKNGNYHFVIDCGSQTPKTKTKNVLITQNDCDDRLNDICGEILYNGKIDLFILTHLHKDHYNGIRFLFNRLSPEVIIMPYLYPEERLCIMLNENIRGENAFFMADPYNSVLRLAEEKGQSTRLLLIRGNTPYDNRNDEVYEGDNVRFPSGERYDDSDDIIEVEGLSKHFVEVVKAPSQKERVYPFDWWFKLFNAEVDKQKLDALRSIYGKLSVDDLIDIINDKNKLKTLRATYTTLAHSLYNDLNNTSIIVYHAPTIKHGKCGTLITGDIDLTRGMANKVLDYFSNELCNIGLFSIPHHGSKYNWNSAFVTNGALNNTVAVTSTHNYYKNRLDSNMMSDLRAHNIVSIVVDENRFSEYNQLIRTFDNDWLHHIIKLNKGRVEIYDQADL